MQDQKEAVLDVNFQKICCFLVLKGEINDMTVKLLGRLEWISILVESKLSRCMDLDLQTIVLTETLHHGKYSSNRTKIGLPTVHSIKLSLKGDTNSCYSNAV